MLFRKQTIVLIMIIVTGFSDVGAKLRRIPGMMPRPFVGRSNPATTWLVDLAGNRFTIGYLKMAIFALVLFISFIFICSSLFHAVV